MKKARTVGEGARRQEVLKTCRRYRSELDASTRVHRRGGELASRSWWVHSSPWLHALEGKRSSGEHPEYSPCCRFSGGVAGATCGAFVSATRGLRAIWWWTSCSNRAIGSQHDSFGGGAGPIIAVWSARVLRHCRRYGRRPFGVGCAASVAKAPPPYRSRADRCDSGGRSLGGGACSHGARVLGCVGSRAAPASARARRPAVGRRARGVESPNPGSPVRLGETSPHGGLGRLVAERIGSGEKERTRGGARVIL